MSITYFENKTFKKVNYIKKPLVKGEYEDCTFIDCIFLNTDLSAFTFVQCEFIHCDLSSAKIYDTIFNEVQFNNCKLLGLAFDSANKFTFIVIFKDCQLYFASFYQLKLKNQNFTDCSLKEVDFTETELTNAKFDNCNLENATFENTILEKADFTLSHNYVIDPERNRIKYGKHSVNNLQGLLKKYNLEIL